MSIPDNRTILLAHIRFFLERNKGFIITKYEWFEEEHETGLILEYMARLKPNISSAREFCLSFNYKMDFIYMQILLPDKPLAMKMLHPISTMDADQMISLIVEWFRTHA